MQARSALFTLFGDVVRPAGGTAWLTTLTACMQTLGFTPQATRTALHRMAADGWVTPTRRGRFSAYRLTDRGVERLDEAAARIYRLRAVDWDGRWHLLVCAGADRNPAVSRELQWSGYGRLSPDVWVTPHPQGARAQRLLATHSLLATRFEQATSPEPDGDARIVARAWDLTQLREAHEEFIARWESAPPPADDQAAFVTRIHLVHHWRSFLFLDPGLPHELLPYDWLGDRAAAAFRTHYEAADAGAWRYWDALVAAAPPVAATASAGVSPTHRTSDPFAQGLDALQTSRPA